LKNIDFEFAECLLLLITTDFSKKFQEKVISRQQSVIS